LAVVDCPIETFVNHTKTSVLFLEKTSKGNKQDYDIFMARADTCGHDKRGKTIFKKSNGKEIVDDDIAFISKEYTKFLKNIQNF